MGDKRRISKDNYIWNGRDLNTGTRERLFPDNEREGMSGTFRNSTSISIRTH